MSMGGGLSLRTVWITLRAINYTTQAFSAISRDIGTLIKSEKKLIEHTNAMRAAALKFISAGIMFSVLGIQLGNTMFSLASSTAQGAAAISQLNANFAMTKQSIGAAIFSILQTIHVFDALNYILNTIRSNQVLAYLVGGFALIATALAIVAGGILLLKGALLAFVTVSKISYTWNLLNAYSLKYLDISLKSVLGSIGLAIGAFMALYAIGKQFGPWVALIVGALSLLAIAWFHVAIAEALGTAGISAVIGGVAVGTVAGIAAGYGIFETGTRSVARTGPALVHKGEIVYNPASRRPTQIANDLEGTNQVSGGRTTNIPIVIENVNTKADFDDLDEQLRKGLKRTMRQSR